MKKKSICILLCLSFIALLFNAFPGSSIRAMSAENDLEIISANQNKEDNLGSQQEDTVDWSGEYIPVIDSVDVDISCCNDCGCNLIDNAMLKYYNDYNIYTLDTRDINIAASIIDDTYSTSAYFPHIDPSTGNIVEKHSGASNHQTQKGLPDHTIPEIAKILPKLQITCTEDNWNMLIQGSILCLKYTGEEQRPITRVINEEGEIDPDTYSIFYRYLGPEDSSDYNMRIDCPYDLKNEETGTVIIKNYLYNSDTVPVSDSCVEEGKYAVVVRFNTKGEYRGNLYTHFIIKKMPTPPPTETPTEIPTQTPTVVPTTKPDVKPTTSPSASPIPTPTVETTTATETEVTTKEKVKAGDTFVSKTAQYTITSGSTLTYDKPVGNGKTAKIPDSIKVNKKTYKVTAVSEQAFYNNKKLKKLTIGKNVTTIGRNAFSSCTKLDSVSFKCKNLTTIESGAFKGCKGIKSISISSKKLKSIGASSFYGCKNLKTVTIKSTKVKFGKNSFKGIYKKATFKVPKSKIKSYKKKLTKTANAPSKITVKKY